MVGASLIDLIFLILAFVSTVLYMSILTILIANRRLAPFKSHFFQLFVSLGVADLCSGLTAHVELTKQWGWLDWTPLFMHPYMGWFFRRLPHACYFLFGMSQYFGVVALAANRYHNIESNLWTSKSQRLALVLQWSIPTLIVIPYISQEFVVFSSNASGVSYVTTAAADGLNGLTAGIYPFSQMVVVVVVAVLYCRIYSSIRKINHDFGLTEDKRRELKLAIVGFILFVVMSAQQLVAVAVMASAVLGRASLFILLHGVLYQLGIVFAYINPWILLGCSKPTRMALASRICPKMADQQGIEMATPVSRPTLRARPAVPEHITTRF